MSRNDAAFYTTTHESDPVWISEDKEVIVYRNGEMRIHYTEPDGAVSVLRYTDDLDDKGLDTDDKLYEAEQSGAIEWWNNPWFEVVWPDNLDGEVVLDYNVAVAMAADIVEERKG